MKNFLSCDSQRVWHCGNCYSCRPKVSGCCPTPLRSLPLASCHGPCPWWRHSLCRVCWVKPPRPTPKLCLGLLVLFIWVPEVLFGQPLVTLVTLVWATQIRGSLQVRDGMARVGFMVQPFNSDGMIYMIVAFHVYKTWYMLLLLVKVLNIYCMVFLTVNSLPRSWKVYANTPSNQMWFAAKSPIHRWFSSILRGLSSHGW